MKKIVLSSKNQSLNKSKPSVVTIILFILLVVYTIGLFVPIIWAIVASFMNKDDFVFYFGSMHAFKNGVKYTFDNYVFAWNNLNVLAVSSNIRYYIPDLLGHSVLYALVRSFSSCFFCRSIASSLFVRLPGCS